ncbi:MAG TPA: FAD-binding oxidoreductase [Candidatus Competibacteraceae bacterium]|nr:FAD-binding oxidoreductase [Candidatus Competibacteraceae bacterium]MCP5133835.1 FAD-binding oxidoreductase [Gammaproteobacteria bacterium]HPF58675.1 FAD-binding oxidoreductase [Candidatus Competibacteraceae bacterium]HRY18616.1 FAD-binding oxidoreductase [Candidatus Competibacteraceae bacterium]
MSAAATSRAPSSWGHSPSSHPYQIAACCNRQTPIPPTDSRSCLPFGNGRSYGDVCLNNNGILLLTRGLDRFIAFDPATGILRAEAGVLLSEILALIVPQGWFLPVTPGTQFVTLGGAIANDVHGKNHHIAGSFGCQIRAFELLRSDNSRRLCTPEQNTGWFRATVGGLGLTGLITWVEIQLQRIANPWIIAENRRFASLDEFLTLDAGYETRYPYIVSWIDCAATGKTLGRGIYMAGMHAPPGLRKSPPPERRALTVPFTPPVPLVNQLSVPWFNRLYYHLPRPVRGLTPYQPFFYPLDNLLNWNRLYGRQGFFQYQCVISPAGTREALLEILARIAASGQGSMLAVLKRFGTKTSGGLLSFPRPGVTLALDFPNRGQPTLDLLEQLDEVTRQAGGAVYPAKDARMSGDSFRQYFPQWQEFSRYIDPRFSSSFWQRVMGD